MLGYQSWAKREIVSNPKCGQVVNGKGQQCMRDGSPIYGSRGNQEGCLEEPALELRGGELSQKLYKGIPEAERERLAER